MSMAFYDVEPGQVWVSNDRRSNPPYRRIEVLRECGMRNGEIRWLCKCISEGPAYGRLTRIKNSSFGYRKDSGYRPLSDVE